MNTEKIPDGKIVLQRATPDDVQAYIEIDKKVGGRTYSPILTEEGVLAELAKGPVYMVKMGDEIAGMVSYEIREDGSVYISGLAVDPKYQGQGIGRQALEAVLLEVGDAPVVDLVTHPDNVKAVKLYESLGFKITGRKENYFGDGEPRIVLTLVQN